MHDIPIEELRYPIGKFKVKRPISNEQVNQFIDDIDTLPSRLRSAVAGFTPEQFNTPYRPGGWTVQQLIHHIADSHMNSLTRFKLALTEDKPVIKPYYEDRWAKLEDGLHASVEQSLNLLEALHHRWVILLKSLNEADLNKTFVHPEHGKEVPLDINIALYSWHSNHHLAHIVKLKERMGWT